MIKLQGLCAQAGDFLLGPIDLEVTSGNYIVISGPSGSGKTTLLETIAGLRKPMEGSIELGGVDVTHHKPADRYVAYVPQDCALFHSMSVKKNVLFGLVQRGFSQPDSKAKLVEIASFFRIRHLLDRYPANLSGGERQRVAMARAVASSPDVLLMDEPFAALDPALRMQMVQLMAQLRDRRHCTVLHVSHHSSDAQNLADQVLEIQDGQIHTQQHVAHLRISSPLPRSLAKRINWRAPGT